ncbi:MAG: DUF3052 domain-containing protein [Bacteroidota bacterium]
MNAGYSGTPLARKLGIKEGFHIVLHNAPGHYFELFSDLPENLEQLENPAVASADFVHAFLTSYKALQEQSGFFKSILKRNGMLWVSWPKGSSKIQTDLKRDMIREHLLQAGLVDIKVAAVDENWSGLKFVYRKKDR